MSRKTRDRDPVERRRNRAMQDLGLASNYRLARSSVTSIAHAQRSRLFARV
jgi:hypothetical protein